MYKRGDPDPTPAGLRPDEMKCPARLKVFSYGRVFYLECTWPDNRHDPHQHVAGAYGGPHGSYVAAAWPVN